MRARSILVVMSVALGGAASCTKFEAGDTPSVDASVADGGAEGAIGSGDASPPNPVGPPPGPGCGGVHSFCDDFDHVNVGEVPSWSLAPMIDGPGGTFAVRGYQDARSAPHVAEAHITSPSRAMLFQEVKMARGVTCTFALRIVSREANATSPSVATLSLASPSGGTYTMELRLDSVAGFGTLPNSTPATPILHSIPPLPTDTWNRLSLAMVLGTDGHVDVAVEDGSVFTQKGPPFTDMGSGGSATLGIGLRPYASKGSWQVLYDDVSCDALP